MATVMIEHLLASGNKPSKRRLPRDRDGTVILDFSSPSITEDLTQVFRRNVARARKENKRLFGSADGVAVKD